MCWRWPLTIRQFLRGISRHLSSVGCLEFKRYHPRNLCQVYRRLHTRSRFGFVTANFDYKADSKLAAGEYRISVTSKLRHLDLILDGHFLSRYWIWDWLGIIESRWLWRPSNIESGWHWQPSRFDFRWPNIESRDEISNLATKPHVACMRSHLHGVSTRRCSRFYLSQIWS